MKQACYSAPKADALPGCATPRTAESLSFLGVPEASESDWLGNNRQNAAGTGAQTPELSPNRRSLGVRAVQS